MSDGSSDSAENYHLQHDPPKKCKLTKVLVQSHKGNPTKSSEKASDDQLS